MKKRVLSLLLAAVAGMALLAGCSDDGLGTYDESKVVFKQLQPMVDGEEIAVVETDAGTFRMRFFPDEAPLAVENFKTLAKEGYYNGKTVFNIQKAQEENAQEVHNIAFVAGAEDSDGLKGKSVVNNGKPYKKELSFNLYPFPGAVAAYSDGKKCDSRFFVVGDVPITDAVIESMQHSKFPELIQNKFKQVGGVPSLTQGYAFFAQVYEGMDVTKTLLETETNMEGKPLNDVRILSVTLESYHADSPESSSAAQ